MNTGDRIKELRKEHGYLQSDLAKMIGCSKQVVSNIERGATDLSANMAQKIAAVCCVNIEDVISELPPDSIKLSAAEKEMIKKYRSLSRKDRELLCGMFDLFYEKNK